MAIKELESRFGSVCPLLKLSQHYNIDYDVVLMAADKAIHQRKPVDWYSNYAVRKAGFDAIMDHPEFADINRDTVEICNWMKEQHAEAEQLEREGRLAFDRTVGSPTYCKWIMVA